VGGPSSPALPAKSPWHESSTRTGRHRCRASAGISTSPGQRCIGTCGENRISVAYRDCHCTLVQPSLAVLWPRSSGIPVNCIPGSDSVRPVRENPVHHCGAPSVAAGTMLSIDTLAATSSCRRTSAPEGGCSGLKLGRAGGHRTAATLPAVLRSSRTLPGGQNDAYRSQKTVKVDDHLGNVG
jgi:hypothetical protein